MRLHFHGKVGDQCTAKIFTEAGVLVRKREGDVPFSIGDGDYINLVIDLQTGQIINWETPSKDALLNFIEG